MIEDQLALNAMSSSTIYDMRIEDEDDAMMQDTYSNEYNGY